MYVSKTQVCTRCKNIKNIKDFTPLKQRHRLHYICKKCRNKVQKEHHKINKEKAINLKGGKCSICGYSKCRNALEFHHVNEKEYDMSKLLKKSWKMNKEKILKELDKCMLVCSNCHREIHLND